MKPRARLVTVQGQVFTDAAIEMEGKINRAIEEGMTPHGSITHSVLMDKSRWAGQMHYFTQVVLLEDTF